MVVEGGGRDHLNECLACLPKPGSRRLDPSSWRHPPRMRPNFNEYTNGIVSRLFGCGAIATHGLLSFVVLGCACTWPPPCLPDPDRRQCWSSNACLAATWQIHRMWCSHGLVPAPHPQCTHSHTHISSQERIQIFHRVYSQSPTKKTSSR